MVEIKKGENIRAEGVRNGDTAKGGYWLCKVKLDKGRDVITVWSNDGGFGASEGDVIKVDDILSVKKSARKYQEKWFDTYDITATLSLVSDKPAQFAELEVPDNDLPF